MELETFEIHQINLTDEQVDEVNSSEDMPEFYKKYTRTTFSPDPSDIYDAIDMYEHIADITAMNKNHVFEVGNVGPESLIERMPETHMHSISVGDILVSKRDGATYYVDSMGFGRLFTNHFSTGPAGIGTDAEWEAENASV